MTGMPARSRHAMSRPTALALGLLLVAVVLWIPYVGILLYFAGLTSRDPWQWIAGWLVAACLAVLVTLVSLVMVIARARARDWATAAVAVAAAVVSLGVVLTTFPLLFSW